MANTIDFILTNSAAELMQKVIGGKTLNFTRMAVGDGFSYDTEIAKGFTTLVNEVLSLDITKQENLSPSSVKFTSAFKNTDAQKEFYYREVGLYAEDPDTKQEVLYAYGNRNDAAELITPSGSSVTSKQLVFIITVGDSANVTFNVNADVYALQEDMLDVQNSITELQTVKANKNLSNTGMITNCLLEVPQNVKLKLTEGILTILAGTKVYFPSGYEDDGITRKFESKILTNDIIVNSSTENKTYITGVSKEGATYRASTENVYSQDTEPANPANLSIWYDTNNNVIKRFVDGSWAEHMQSLPLGITSWANGLCTLVNQVFNGMGYIGTTVFILPDVKGLIPNGRNPDGTLNNIEFTAFKLITHTFSFTQDVSNLYVFMHYDNILSWGYMNAQAFSYDEKLNVYYLNNTTIQRFVPFVIVNVLNKKISTFTPFKPFQAVDYNTYLSKITELESRLSALEEI